MKPGSGSEIAINSEEASFTGARGGRHLTANLTPTTVSSQTSVGHPPSAFGSGNKVRSSDIDSKPQINEFLSK